MMKSDRREFLAEVGQGMVTVVVGTALSTEMGLSTPVHAEEKPASSDIDRLAKVILESPPAKLFATCKRELDKGTSLRQLVAGAALANARAFAGQHYEGYHTFMALAPAFAMASDLPANEQALPIFKVLYRNSRLLHADGRARRVILGEESPAELSDQPISDQIIQAARRRKIDQADKLTIAAYKQHEQQAYEDIQPLVQDMMNVHKVVLTWRAREILHFTGKDQALVMLRQTVRHCADYPEERMSAQTKEIRTVLPKLFDTHRLTGKKPGKRTAADSWVNNLAQTVYAKSSADAAGAVAEALADGISPDVIGEAISLAATQLVLADKGRQQAWPGKPLLSVHGDSVGVHASDAANAWRHIAGVCGARNTFASLICAAYHTAGQTHNQMSIAYPHNGDLEKIKTTDAAKLLVELDEAIRAREQARACAIVQAYGKQGHDAKAVFPVLRKYAISEDGALHAEKYYRTASEEFARSRPAFRWRHLVALARVTASLYGHPAPGLEEARKMLKG